MPRIKLKHIVSVSSEDPVQPAVSLLKPEGLGMWRCNNPGEKQVSVIIQLEKETWIHAIDIGNNGSALIEILVGRSSWPSDEPYKVLLVTSSFMSPMESKNFQFTHKVRMFANEKLTKPVAEQKWDRVKIVCTQPFNLKQRYGLRFISLHSPPDLTEQEQCADMVPASLGFFKLKEKPTNNLATGSLFKQKGPPTLSGLSAAASIRDASAADQRETAAMPPAPTCSAPPGRERRSPTSKISNNNVAGEPRGRIQPVARSSHLQRPVLPQNQGGNPPTSKRKHEDPLINTVVRSTVQTAGRHSAPPPKKAKVQRNNKVPLNQILGGVVFVLSGFQNPERGNLRDRALQMGAQYRRDWGPGCTHLICAFANTPKYQKVTGSKTIVCHQKLPREILCTFSQPYDKPCLISTGKGTIVTKRWITDCFKRETRLPARRYRLSGDSSSSDEGDSDQDARSGSRSQQPDAANGGSSPKIQPKSPASSLEECFPAGTEAKGCPVETAAGQDECEGSTDVESTRDDEGAGRGGSPAQVSSSELDTEDELQKALVGEDQYSGTTEDEDEDLVEKPKSSNLRKKKYSSILGFETALGQSDSDEEDLPFLPDFFSNKHFLLYGELDIQTRRSVIRYITAYDGTIEEYMSENVDFVITRQAWDSNFNEALAENMSLAFVRPDWIFACHERGAFVPFQSYIITPPQENAPASW